MSFTNNVIYINKFFYLISLLFRFIILAGLPNTTLSGTFFKTTGLAQSKHFSNFAIFIIEEPIPIKKFYQY